MFGVCVITVSLCSGCATGTPSKIAMNTSDVKNLQPDCRNKQEQIKLLKSLRQASENQLWDAMLLASMPMSHITHPEEYQQAKSLLSGEHQRSIDYNLYFLNKHC
jgi:hypothetical protein